MWSALSIVPFLATEGGLMLASQAKRGRSGVQEEIRVIDTGGTGAWRGDKLSEDAWSPGGRLSLMIRRS